MSHTNVQPMEMEMEGPGLLPVGQQPGVRMHNIPGKPGTLLGLVFRCIQFVRAIISCVVMANTNFTHSPTYSFLVAAAGLMFLWSFSLAILDLYALLVRRHLRRTWLDCFFTVGDAITGLLLYTAASMSGGFSKFMCKPTDCARITTSTVFAYLCVAAVSLSFFLNFSSLAS